MSCDEYREMLDPYLDESLEEEPRRDFRRHLRECASCRQWAVASEPTLFFALAGKGKADPARVEACAEAVTAGIRQARLTRRMAGRRRPWLAAAAALVVVVGGGLTWRITHGGGEALPAPEMEVRTEAAASPVPPTVEVDMTGQDLRVYQFATDEDADTAVYFVVNPAMEL